MVTEDFFLENQNYSYKLRTKLFASIVENTPYS